MWEPSVSTEKEKDRMAGVTNIFLVLSSDFSCLIICPQNYAECLLLLHIINMKLKKFNKLQKFLKKLKRQTGREWQSHDSNTGLRDSYFAHCLHSTSIVK